MRNYYYAAGLVLLLQAHIAFGDIRNDGTSNITVIVNSTLSGEPAKHYPVTVVLSSVLKTVKVEFSAPYSGDDAVQRIHVFIANEDKHITELEFVKELGGTNAETSKVRLYWAPYNVLRSTDDFEVKSQVVNDMWTGSLDISSSFLPPSPSLVNVAAAHQLKDDVHWDSLYSITNSGIAIPDLMVLQRYRKINPSILSTDTEYSSEWKAV